MRNAIYVNREHHTYGRGRRRLDFDTTSNNGGNKLEARSYPFGAPAVARDFNEERKMSEAPEIRQPEGRLGVLMPGMGAVATTLVAGVELVKKGLGEPVGSLTQLGTVRLGKRTEDRVPKIKDFVPLSGMEDLVFGGWDAFPDDAYEAAVAAGVLNKEHLNAVQDELLEVRPILTTFVYEPLSATSASLVPSTMFFIFSKETSQVRVLKPQSVLTSMRSGPNTSDACKIRSRTSSAGSTKSVWMSITPSPILPPQALSRNIGRTS
jgi:Myo-inositol-1-phosphate synthase